MGDKIVEKLSLMNPGRRIGISTVFLGEMIKFKPNSNDNMKKILETDRLILREFGSRDAEYSLG